MSIDHLTVSDFGEKKLIKRIIEKSKNFQIGDDAALLDFKLNNLNSYLVATSDLLIEKSHFPKQMSYFQIGWKSIIVNISDLAAMGANPAGILINLAIPNSFKLSYFDELIDGILSACSLYNIPLVGGDTNQGEEIIISGTALGFVEKDKALNKHGFKEGDLVCVTGDLGLSALGFELFKSLDNIKKIKHGLNQNKFSQNIVDLAIEKVLNPNARLNEGLILKDFNSNLSSISTTDITDGLASELYEFIDANKKVNRDNENNILGIKIYEDKLPINEELKIVANFLNIDPLKLILHIGEDFELVFTINGKNIVDLEKLLDFTIIGEVTTKSMVEIELSNGKCRKLSSKGYEHLSNSEK